MAQTRVITLDLKFQGRLHAIASYLIRSGDAVVLIESGPGSTLAGLEAGLANEGLSPRDVTHVLLTHIHLDHAGAAGWLAPRMGAWMTSLSGRGDLCAPRWRAAYDQPGEIAGKRHKDLWRPNGLAVGRVSAGSRR